MDESSWLARRLSDWVTELSDSVLRASTFAASLCFSAPFFLEPLKPKTKNKKNRKKKGFLMEIFYFRW